MIVEIEVDGRTRAVDVNRQDGGWQVTIDGRSMAVTAVAVDGRWSLLVGDAPAPRAWRSYEVTLEPYEGGQVVRVDGAPVRLAVLDRHARAARMRGGPPSDGSGPRAVVAPMPGRVVKVLVEPGQTVAARQGVVVVEAMKMENELRAPRAGTVAEVYAAEGMSVEAHTVLVVLE